MHNLEHYTFEGLDSLQGPTGGSDTMGYLVGLANAATHPIADPVAAKQIIRYLFDIEEQTLSAAILLESERSFCNRFFPGGYEAQTPCMLAKRWSPIAAMLRHGLHPTALARESKIRATASGIWAPAKIRSVKTNEEPSEELFWSILAEAFARAQERGLWVSIIARPGWSYDDKINSLPDWPAEEVSKAHRIIWKRTPEDT